MKINEENSIIELEPTRGTILVDGMDTAGKTPAQVNRMGLQPYIYHEQPFFYYFSLPPAVADGPDNDYWDHVDHIVARANALGMYVGMLPTWGRYRLVATRDTAGTYAMVYVPSGRRFAVNTSRLRGKRLKAWWFNPRDGKATAIGTFANDGNPLTFAPPTDGELTDWVLVLDDVSCRYPAPGSRRWKGDWSR